MELKRLVTIILFGFVAGGLFVYVLMKSDKDKEKHIEITHNMVVQRVEAMGKLEVVKYNIQDIMEYKKTRQWLPNAKTILVVSGEVIGCIDLSKVTTQDIYTLNDSISLILPQPEICQAKINHSQSKIHNIEFGLWESDKIADDAYRFAEKELYEKALAMNFGTESRNNAQALLKPLLHAMGFKKVTIGYKATTTPIEGKTEMKFK